MRNIIHPIQQRIKNLLSYYLKHNDRKLINGLFNVNVSNIKVYYIMNFANKLL